MCYKFCWHGALVAIEGGDATGKATQARLLAHRIVSEKNTLSRVFSFPQYDGRIGKCVLDHLHGKAFWGPPYTGMGDEGPNEDDKLVFQALMMMDRMDASVDIIRLADDERMAIVVDRWWQSSVVYGGLDSVNAEWTSRVSSLLPSANVNILIDLDSKTAMERRPVPRDRYEESQDFREKARQSYLKLWEKYAELGRLKEESDDYYENWEVVDGSGSTEEVHERIWAAANKYVIDFPL